MVIVVVVVVVVAAAAAAAVVYIIGGSFHKHRDKHNCHVTKVLLRQAYFSLDKRSVLSRQTRVCRDNTCLSRLSRQNYVCCDKHIFVATKDVLFATKNDTCGSSRQ